ncbi:MAG: hypothetical protein U0704_01650 [Candidatus Eisenbacteria bacterium]
MFERIAGGRLSASVALVLAPRLREASVEAWLALAERCSRGELLRLLAERDHAARESAMPTPASSNPPASVASGAAAEVSLPDLLGPDTPMTVPAPGQVKTQVRGRVIETESGARGIRVELTAEEFADFVKARDLLAHVGCNGDAAEVIARARGHDAAHLEKQQYGTKRRSGSAKR